MEMDRYGSRRGGLDVNGLALALGATAALLFGLTLTAPHFTLVPEQVLKTTNIRLDDPPPPKPEPKPEPRIRAAKAPTVPRPDPIPTTLPPIGSSTSDVRLTPVEAPATTGDVVGLGTGNSVTPPVHVPVERAARLDARYADAFQPDYPVGERLAERAGRVVVRVLIGTDGRVHDVQQVSAASPAFFEATRKRALAKWRFEPATRDGTAIEAWQVVGVSFVLGG